MGWLKLKEYGLKEAYIRKLMKEFGAYSDMFIASNFNLFSDKFTLITVVSRNIS